VATLFVINRYYLVNELGHFCVGGLYPNNTAINTVKT